MAYSYIEYTADGSTNTFSIPFSYTAQQDISVYVAGSATTAFTFTSSSTISLTSTPTNGQVVRVARTTSLTNRAVDFSNGAILTENDLDKSAEQLFFASQEAIDTAGESLFKTADGKFDAQSRVIKNVADPVAAQDAVTKTWAETAMDSQLTQATSAKDAAQTSETNAATSASNAQTSFLQADTAASQSAAARDTSVDAKDDAEDAESNAALSATAAENWAIKGVVVENGEYSSKYHASAASVSASAASSSATTSSTQAATSTSKAIAAATSETNAATSETNAATSASNASTSATNASTSASTATAQASTATTKATEASTSATNASSSASTATTQASTATTQASTATTQASNAASSASSASGSASTATTQASTATTQASTATTKASEASVSAAAALVSKLAAASSANDINVAAIDASISDTAVDVFVYDTSKDSDGGQWRKRTQHTSWYNETLNTSTRGSRKEFPSVAVIVAESNQVTIYDGDDPDMPMWMVFNVNTNYMIRTTAVSSLSMLNGEMYIALQSNGDMTYISFIKDTARWITASTAYGGFYKQGGISNRNDGAAYGYYNNVAGISDITIVNSMVNDVAMTVLPNAPIDSATGLPIPTIAVATDGGVSVIKDDGSVVDFTHTVSAYSVVASVAFTDNKDVIWNFDSDTTPRRVFVRAIPASDTVAVSADSYGISPTRGYGAITDVSNGSYGSNLVGTENTFLTSIEDTTLATGGNKGLSVLDENTSTPTEGSVAYITSDYSTGYMVGDIKLAALSDTDDTDVTGSELVTNATDRDFSGSLVNWSGTISPAGGVGVLSDGTTASASLAVSGLTIGQRYVLSFDIPSITTGTPRMYITGADTSGIDYSTGSWSRSFTAGSASIALVFYVNGAGGGNYQLDNISCRLADSDRSVNGNGLAVHGTITKDPVATGAELVWYKASSAPSNHHMYVPVTDWSIGTGDFCISFWCNTVSGGDGEQLYLGPDTMTEGSPSSGFNIWTYGTTQKMYLSGAYFAYPTAHNSPRLITIVRRSGWVYVHENGILKTSGLGAGAINDDKLRVLHGWYGASNAAHNMALLRISATAPSASQIKKIYEDEKPLFQENAKATLYGTSDAVTALAHDDDTNLLHVGTSAGRSVFQGLRRVENTTDAVGSCISAANGLVAED